MGVDYKTDKATRVLMLYHRLLRGEQIDKATFVIENGINERTFDRDIECIRLFLSEIHATDEVSFDRQTGTYFMSKVSVAHVDRIDATVIAKVLLSSAAFRSDEMEGLYKSIMSTMSRSDAKVVSTYLENDVAQYYSNNGAAIIKMLGDLYIAINNCMDIEIHWINQSGQNKRNQVAPLEIILLDNSFNLVCADELDYSKITNFPVESIVRFNVLKTAFAKAYKEKYYKEKENIRHGC